VPRNPKPLAVELADTKYCRKPKYVVFIRNGRITIAFRAAGENRRSRTHSCNLAREWRTLEKEVRNFLFQSTVTH
jgi:hypothetical protein